MEQFNKFFTDFVKLLNFLCYNMCDKNAEKRNGRKNTALIGWMVCPLQ